MITVIANMRVLPENAAAYEEILDYVMGQSLEKEPGVKYYAWAKSADDPDLYLVVEVYEDEKAQAAHMETDWVRNSLPKTQGLIEGGLEIKQYVTPGQQPIKLRYG